MAYRKTTGNALFKQERQIDMLSEKNGTDTVIFERRPVAISTSTGDPNLHVFSLAFRTSEMDAKSLASKQGYSCPLHFESNVTERFMGSRFAGVEYERFRRSIDGKHLIHPDW